MQSIRLIPMLAYSGYGLFSPLLCTRVADSTFIDFPKLECAHALKGLALPDASHSSKIALAGSRRLRSVLAAVPVLLRICCCHSCQKQVVSAPLPVYTGIAC